MVIAIFKMQCKFTISSQFYHPKTKTVYIVRINKTLLITKVRHQDSYFNLKLILKLLDASVKVIKKLLLHKTALSQKILLKRKNLSNAPSTRGMAAKN